MVSYPVGVRISGQNCRVPCDSNYIFSLWRWGNAFWKSSRCCAMTKQGVINWAPYPRVLAMVYWGTLERVVWLEDINLLWAKTNTMNVKAISDFIFESWVHVQSSETVILISLPMTSITTSLTLVFTGIQIPWYPSAVSTKFFSIECSTMIYFPSIFFAPPTLWKNKTRLLRLWNGWKVFNASHAWLLPNSLGQFLADLFSTGLYFQRPYIYPDK